MSAAPGPAAPAGGLLLGRGDGLVLAATALWSLNVVVVKEALSSSGPLTYSVVRYVLGGVLLLLLARRLEGPFPRLGRRELGLVCLAALTGVLVNQASFTVALSLTSADNVAMISGLTPLLVAVWAVWRERERFGPRVWSGLSLGFLGLVLVVGSGSAGRSTWVGLLVALWNPVSWAVYLFLLPRLLSRMGPLTVSAWVTSLGALMMFPFGLADTLLHPPHPSLAWLGLLGYSAILALVVTSWIYLVGVRRLGPARTAVYVYLQPFISVLAAALLIGEPVLPLQLLGGAIMLAGVLWGRPRARPGPAPGQLQPAPPAGAGALGSAARP